MHVSTYDTNDPVELGQQTVYVITVNNQGSGICTRVKICNELPKEMEFVKAEGPVEFNYDKLLHQVYFTETIMLQPSGKLVYKITCRAISEGNAKNIVSVKYDQFSKPIVDEEVTSTYK